MSDFKKLMAYEPCSVEYVSVGGTSCIEQLKAENEKLRELVSGLEYCVREPVCDCCCPLYDQSGVNHRRCESLERELGVKI